MKKRGKPILYAFAAALAATFACCAGEDHRGVAPGQEEAVRWRIRINSAEVSRGDDGAFPGGTNTIVDATLYFYREGDGRLLRLRPLSVEEIASANAGTPLLILSVPASANRFVMVANNGASRVDISNFTTISDVRNTAFGIATQMTAGAHSAENVILAGTSGIFAEREPGLYDAAITIAPVVARLEIGPLHSLPLVTGEDTPGDVTSFTVSGIYLNRFHLQSDLNPIPAGPVDNGQTAANYSPLNPDYAGSLLFDRLDIASVAGLAVPATGEVWAYQFFPSQIPHIIIELSDILYSDGQNGTTAVSPRSGATGVQYLTVQSYSLETDGNLLSSVERARIYKISRLEFTPDHFGDYPYDARVVITATLTVAPWDEELINTEYD